MSAKRPQRSLILVLDDEAPFRQSMAARLSDLMRRHPAFGTVSVISAASRDEAIEQLHAQGIDLEDPPSLVAQLLTVPLALAIVDQRMGDYDPEGWPDDVAGAEGISFVKILKALTVPPQVLMLTAHARTIDTQGYAAARAGADAYLDKNDLNPSDIEGQVLAHLTIFFNHTYPVASHG